MRVAFLGNAPWSVPSLDAIARSAHDVVVVVTRVPRPAGRGNRHRPTAVADAARARGLPLHEVETVSAGPGFDALAEREPDILAVVAYGEIVPQAVLDVPRVAPVNVHFSLLPQLRGAAPVQRAMLEGLGVTGVTTIRMDAGMDTGPILLQREEPIRPDDDAGSLGERLARVGGEMLVATIDGLESGALTERAQDESAATFAPKLKPEDRAIDWSQPDEAIIRRVRALSPEPGAEARFRGRNLKVYRARRAVPGAVRDGPVRPGEINGGSSQELIVATGGEPLRLDEVALEGRKRMTGAEFVRGYRPEPGEVLG